MKKVRGIGLGLIILGALAVGGCFLFPNRPPVAEFNFIYNQDPDDPLVVVLDASASSDPDGDETIVWYWWNFDEDVQTISSLVYTNKITVETVTVRYPFEGTYWPTLAVEDNVGKMSETVMKQLVLPNEEVEPTE